MFDPQNFRGIVPPVCTPQTDDGEIDFESIKTLVDFQIENGVHGIFALGSTGEFALLTNAQRAAAVKAFVEAAAGRVPVLIGILDTSTARSIENGLIAKEAGADAVVLSVPFYTRNSQVENIEHFRAVKAAVDLPLIAYDVPGAVNVKLEFNTVLTLAKEGTICGIKDSSGNVENFRRLINASRDLPGFSVFTGSELILDSCFQMGAHGSVPGLGNIFPAEYVQIYDLSQAGKWEEAAAIQNRLLDCFFELIGQGEPQYSFTASALGGFKTGLKVRGAIKSTHAGAPVHSFTEAEEARVADVMRRHGFI
jgi:4-hydroxy-tetrahydrodipicolinate synthase